MRSIEGCLLAASPHLPDPNFAGTVVLIIHHNEEGAFGVVLNRPSDHTVKDVWDAVGDHACESHQVLNLGGPIGGPLMAIHTEPSLSETEILPGVYFSARREALEELVQSDDQPFLIFSGYSGWGEGQLERELSSGDWLLTAATLEYIFHDSESLWQTVAKHIGDEILFSSLHIKHVPDDPSMN